MTDLWERKETSRLQDDKILCLSFLQPLFESSSRYSMEFLVYGLQSQIYLWITRKGIMGPSSHGCQDGLSPYLCLKVVKKRKNLSRAWNRRLMCYKTHISASKPWWTWSWWKPTNVEVSDRRWETAGTLTHTCTAKMTQRGAAGNLDTESCHLADY